MKKIFTGMLVILFAFCSTAWAQKKKNNEPEAKDWSSYDFTKHYTFKNGGGKKEFVKNKRIFIANFNIGQNVLANGKQTGASSFAKMTVGLTELDVKAYQTLVDKLYKQVVDQFKAEGYEIVSDEEVAKSEFAKQEHNGKNVFCQVMNEPGKHEDQFGNEWIYFYPSGKFVVVNTKTILGTWPTKFSKAINANVISISLNTNSVAFDGSRRTGYKGGASIEGEPALSIYPYCSASNSSGGFGVWGTAVSGDNDNWVGPKGMFKTDKSTTIFGSAKGSYVIDVKQEAYLSEVEKIGAGLSKGFVNGLLAELK